MVVRLFLMALVLGLNAGAASGDTRLSGGYVGLGLAPTVTRLSFDTLSASVNGGSVNMANSNGFVPYAMIGYRENFGSWVLGGEIDMELGRRSLGPGNGCALFRNCAAAGVVGEIGPLYRLRLVLGRDIDSGLMLLGGAGIAVAQVSTSAAYVTSSSVSGTSSSFSRAISPFSTNDRAVGFTLGLGVEQRLSQRLSLRLDANYDRLYVDTASRLLLSTSNTTGPNTSQAVFSQSGNFDFDMLSARISLILHF